MSKIVIDVVQQTRLRSLLFKFVSSTIPFLTCVVTTKDLEPACRIGNNSPASRPEFVDISLNATSVAQQETIEEGLNENDEENDG